MRGLAPLNLIDIVVVIELCTEPLAKWRTMPLWLLPLVMILPTPATKSIPIETNDRILSPHSNRQKSLLLMRDWWWLNLRQCPTNECFFLLPLPYRRQTRNILVIWFLLIATAFQLPVVLGIVYCCWLFSLVVVIIIFVAAAAFSLFSHWFYSIC